VDLAQVADLPGSVDRDETARLAVAALVEGEDGERVGEGLRQEVEILALPTEAVQGDDRRVSGGRRSVARLVERRRDPDAVAHAQRHVLLRERGSAAGRDQRDD